MRALLDRIGVKDAIDYVQDYGGPIGWRLDAAQVADLIKQTF